jgi:ABC-type antimicrobial peptide transport system permease subunit
MFLTHLRIAIASLRSTRVRTALTTLGIVIGVMSITLVLALGEGAKQAVSNHVKALDENIAVIRPGKTTHSTIGTVTNYNPLGSYATSTLTENDLTTIQEMKGVKAVAPLMLINGSVKFNKHTAPEAPIVATTPDLAKILKLTPRQGQFLDGTTSTDTTVIGEQLSIELFGTDQSIGRQLKIRGHDFTIIGVIKKIDNPLGVNGINVNRAAIVSIQSGKAFNQGIVQIQQMSVQPTHKDELVPLTKKIAAALLANHDGEEDFSVLTGKEAGDISSGFFQIIVGMTAAIATVSLVVGGVGIMNIMLVSVAERTREVGIRKSLGANNQQILIQFLIESILMSTFGGLIGYILAYGLAFALSLNLAFQPVITWYIFALAMGLSLLVGIAFGIFPAIRAARKDPITALRQYH